MNKNSHGHGIKVVRANQPSSKLRNRSNKAKARPQALARVSALRAALAKGN